MKTKWIYLGLLLGLTVVRGSMAQTAVETAVSAIRSGQDLTTDMVSLADAEQNTIATQTDRVLALLLSIPFEQRQYVFPALFEEPMLPKKIRTHPEIAIWQGKKPTRIAPEMQRFAAEYLADLDPKLYPYLSPDAFPQVLETDTMTLSGDPDKTPLRFAPMKKSGPIRYLSVRDYIRQPADLRENPTKGVLQEKQIQGLNSGLQAVNHFLAAQEQNDSDFSRKMRFLTVFYTPSEEERVNPFQSLMQRLRLMNKADELSAVLRQVGWDSADTFALAADTVAKAYRVQTMPLPFAFEARRRRGHVPQTDADKIILIGFRQYEALPADVKVVHENRELVQNAFRQNGYQNLLRTLHVDEWEK